MSNKDPNRPNSIQFQKNAGTNSLRERKHDINRTGLNRKLVSTVIKGLEEQGVAKVSAAEIKDIYLRLLNCTNTELEKMAADPDLPSLVKDVIEAKKNGKGYEINRDLIERAIGKSEANVKIENNVIAVTVPEDSAFDLEDGKNEKGTESGTMGEVDGVN